MIHFIRGSRAIILPVLAAIFCAGCATVSNQPRSGARDGAEIKIPFFNTEFRGVIALPATKQSEATIKVVVRGEVVKPGVYEVREGTSILQAVQVAGGFTDYAAPWAVKVYDEQKWTLLRLHRHKRLGRLPLVWITARGEGEIFIVKDGMTIAV